MLSIFTYLCYLNRLINKLHLIRAGKTSLKDRTLHRTFTLPHTGTNSFQPKVCFKGVMVMMMTMMIMMMMMMMMMVMMMMMMNCFCGMVDRGKAFSLIFSQDYCHSSSPSRISETQRARFKPV